MYSYYLIVYLFRQPHVILVLISVRLTFISELKMFLNYSLNYSIDFIFCFLILHFIFQKISFSYICNIFFSSILPDIPEQGKTSPFMMKPTLNNQNKHVPNIKIKPIVRKSRLNSNLRRHRKATDHDVSFDKKSLKKIH